MAVPSVQRCEREGSELTYRRHYDCISEESSSPLIQSHDMHIRRDKVKNTGGRINSGVCAVGSRDADGCDVMVDTRGPAVTGVAKPLQLFCWAGVGRRGASALRLLVF